MGPVLGVVPPGVRIVGAGDLAQILPWLVPRLAEDHPGGHEDFVSAYLADRSLAKFCWFAHSGPVVGLAEFSRSPLAPRGLVTEIFVRAREPDNAAAIALYRAMRDWALEVGAQEMRFNLDSDAAITHVVAALFDLSRDLAPKKRSLYVATLR